jgi:SAM-dependent methyltransferase
MKDEIKKPEFWEAAFTEKREMWGWEPTRSAVITKDLFVEKGVKNVLIPGIGYGRNAAIFMRAGIDVTGIEISRTAIEMAAKHFDSLPIHHGSVTEMPFDDKKYDGIFCYGLIYLLEKEERAKLIRDCYHQLNDKGHMVFTVISKEAPTYGQGEWLSEDRYELFGGVKMYFYDEDSIQAEFGAAGLYAVEKVMENYPFYLVKCRKD